MEPKKSSGIHIILIFIVVVCAVFFTGCLSQNTIQNSSGSNILNTPDSMLVQTQCSPEPGNATPFIIINPIGSHIAGDVFEIKGTTNLGVNSTIFFDLREPQGSELAPGSYVTPPPHYEYSGTKGYVKIQNGACGINFWSYLVNVSGYHHTKYTVNVWKRDSKTLIQNWTEFHIN